MGKLIYSDKMITKKSGHILISAKEAKPQGMHLWKTISLVQSSKNNVREILILHPQIAIHTIFSFFFKSKQPK